MEAQPQAEAVGERNFFLHCLAGIDRGAAFIVHQVARHQVAAVGGCIEQHILGPAFDAAFQRRLERLVTGVVLVEGKIVAIKQEAALAGAQQPQKLGQAGDILAMHLDQHQTAVALVFGVERGMHRLDQRAFAHAARAPEQRIVGGQAPAETFGVGEQRVALAFHALEQGEVYAGDLGHGNQAALQRLPDIGIAPAGQAFAQRRRRLPLQRLDDPRQDRFLALRGAVFAGFFHSNPLFFHGCKPVRRRYSPRAF